MGLQPLDQMLYNLHEIGWSVQYFTIGFATLRPSVVQSTWNGLKCAIFNNWVYNTKNKYCTNFLKMWLGVQYLTHGFTTLRQSIIPSTWNGVKHAIYSNFWPSSQVLHRPCYFCSVSWKPQRSKIIIWSTKD